MFVPWCVSATALYSWYSEVQFGIAFLRPLHFTQYLKMNGTVIKTLLMHVIHVPGRVCTLRRSACYYLKLLKILIKSNQNSLLYVFPSFYAFFHSIFVNKIIERNPFQERLHSGDLLAISTYIITHQLK